MLRAFQIFSFCLYLRPTEHLASSSQAGSTHKRLKTSDEDTVSRHFVIILYPINFLPQSSSSPQLFAQINSPATFVFYPHQPTLSVPKCQLDCLFFHHLCYRHASFKEEIVDPSIQLAQSLTAFALCSCSQQRGFSVTSVKISLSNQLFDPLLTHFIVLAGT